MTQYKVQLKCDSGQREKKYIKLNRAATQLIRLFLLLLLPSLISDSHFSTEFLQLKFIIFFYLFFSLVCFLGAIATAPIDANADPVLHTCQTVGRLSNKVARRVYRTVSRQVKLLKKEDVHEYVASLIAVLRLTQYLNFINEKVQTGQSTLSVDNENEKNEQKQQH